MKKDFWTSDLRAPTSDSGLLPHCRFSASRSPGISAFSPSAFRIPSFFPLLMSQTDEIPDEVTSSGAGWVSVVTPKKPLLHLPLREIWRYRDLITLMIWRDFISMHKQTIFGPLWYFVQPLVSTVVYQIVFGNIARIPTNNIPPFLFYMSGIVIWYYFSACLSRTATHFLG